MKNYVTKPQPHSEPSKMFTLGRAWGCAQDQEQQTHPRLTRPSSGVQSGSASMEDKLPTRLNLLSLWCYQVATTEVRWR